MKTAIIPNENLVVIDGQAASVDLSALRDAGVHAVQRDDDTAKLEVEYVKPANEPLTEEVYAQRYGEYVAAAQAIIAGQG